ncbi:MULTISPECIES: MdtA/MuxA family multidrug efflux RND transporter periplasmic adaptor subunit [Proteus]|uniref:MdtA/MuxA family multidrug efflux RND transporter periplasmic adaptor subunit n=1 Tax=Proteus TaxID=583 RepID=UPI001377A655|nr:MULTISPECIES: MdtA/MuxA family multidrug efflux RND transporter periplasmic adaptor subunit [Proteus]MCX2589332.1 MdtA/MuxA family multidrug efflux RND transporter periplasmic adaptor subunit [Proteus penneri]NBL78221.1 MdtA/MuxA family multidrug efflux RND transporter periplasmic adaptor subunit [Proteus sp. G2672]NBL90388.1 MdtA/MuxA family multidrug efflux RND transporter periplasmic adaptor subunit [Proteus sp. G2673]NBM04464.1 MdtA/MuxA family multidrug efflux RND transporter periplasmi
MNKNKNAKKRVSLIIALIVVIAGGYAYWQFNAAKTASPENKVAQATNSQSRSTSGSRRPPLPPVQVATSTQEDVPQFLSALGTVKATNSVTVTSRVEGQLMALHFTEGQHVQQGDLLAEIDSRPFEVQLAQAKGQLAKDQATLANARLDLARYQKLAKTNLVSQQELDNQQALVKQSEASIRIDEATISNAQLQLTYSKITAPISGQVGLKQVDVGNYISGGSSTPIVVINQMDPVDVLFTLPEQDLAKVIQARKNSADLPVTALDRNNQFELAQGKLFSVDNQIDATTGTIKLKARFPQQETTLFPNQFVNVRLYVATLEKAVVIPNAALQMGNEGHFVWVVDSENKVSKLRVEIALQNAEKVVIASGLSADQRVVTDGVDRLTQGAKVEIVTPTAPKTKENNRVVAEKA